MFFGKLFIFQRAFSRKLSYFPVFGNNLENEFENPDLTITLISLHNTHVLNYTRKKIAYQTPKNILKLIFKVVIKHLKMRQFSRKRSLENEQFSRKH